MNTVETTDLISIQIEIENLNQLNLDKVLE